jgi:exopolysaccharide biosynthesis WecB/TagA/CpsF family protein
MPRDTVSESAKPSGFEILGVRIDRETMESALDWIEGRVAQGGRHTAQFVNAHCLNLAYRHRSYSRVLSRADRVFADGSGIRLACRILGLEQPDNVNGTDMLPLLCERAAAKGLRLYFLGGAPSVACYAAQELVRRYPGLKVVGNSHGYFSSELDENVCADINRSGADIVLVGMGAPRQEMWIDTNRQQIDAALVMGVGGLFDFYSGRIPRAPLWMRRTGLEWCWRLAQEPARMWRRYVLGNPVFIARVAKERLDRRFEERARERLLSRYDRPFALTLHRLRFAVSSALWRAGIWAWHAAKRGLDIAAAGTLLLMLMPFFLAVAALIRMESPGPVLFRQKRVGLHGKLFTMWKFRSMYIDAEARKAALMAANEMQGGVLFKMKNDPRITRVGRFIRKASIDELPQLWNVVTGDMSLVGPRPPLPSEVALYSLRDRRRLDGVPGITCTWQVSGRSNIPFPRQVALDVEYLESRSLWRDLVILLKTVPAVLTGRGAM